jgi:hypothetical protein
MDPYGPVRYKGLSLFPTGYGTALAQAMVRGGDIQVYGEIIAQQFFSTWIGQIFEDVDDAATLSGMFEKCRSALAQRMPGYGLERVLYMTNMEVGCLSPTLQNYFVLAPGGLLWALEDVSRRADRPEAILDRHMVAFISVREPKMIDPHFGFVNSSVKGHQVIGIMRTLAAIQRRFSVGTVPGVTNWLSTMTSHAIELLHDRDLRQMMAKRINTIKDNGMISALLEVVDDSALVRDDAQRFAWAQHEYRSLTTEKGQIETLIRTRKNFGKATGRQVSMFLSVVLATAIVVIYVVMHLIKVI